MCEELKPCPFCGGEAHFRKVKHHAGVWYSVCCDDAECIGHEQGRLYTLRRLAAEAWNKRVDERGECEMKFVYYDLFPCDSVYRCMKCGTENPYEFKYCPGCGAKVTSEREYCIKQDPDPDPDISELLEVADEIEESDVDGCVDWHNRIRKALGVE